MGPPGGPYWGQVGAISRPPRGHHGPLRGQSGPSSFHELQKASGERGKLDSDPANLSDHECQMATDHETNTVALVQAEKEMSTGPNCKRLWPPQPPPTLAVACDEFTDLDENMFKDAFRLMVDA